MKKDIIQSFIKLGCKCTNNGYYLYDIQKWLREIHNLYIQINLNEDLFGGKNSKLFYVEIIDIFKQQIVYEKNLELSYEDALIEAIWNAYDILTKELFDQKLTTTELNKLYITVCQTLMINSQLRIGQVLYSTLYQFYPKLATEISRTSNDPFYNNDNINNCLKYITKNE